MPYIVPIMPAAPSSQLAQKDATMAESSDPSTSSQPDRIRIKNRRKRYLDTHPDYFGSDLELADPLLYDRLIRRFQTPAEREAEGRKKGFSGVLEADLWRSEAKFQALQNPDPNSMFTYKRGPHGEIVAEDKNEAPQTKEEGYAMWKDEMEMRFMRGDDDDFDYETVDRSEEYDDRVEEDRAALDDYLDTQEPAFILEEGASPQGETGIQDF